MCFLKAVCMPLVPALWEKHGQIDTPEFKVSLVYVENSRPAKATQW